MLLLVSKYLNSQLRYKIGYFTAANDVVYNVVHFPGGKGDWSNKGCTRQKTYGKTIVCACDHMTNFAALIVSTASQCTVNRHLCNCSLRDTGVNCDKNLVNRHPCDYPLMLI